MRLTESFLRSQFNKPMKRMDVATPQIEVDTKWFAYRTETDVVPHFAVEVRAVASLEDLIDNQDRIARLHRNTSLS